MPSDKFHSLVGMQDTEKAMKHVRLIADERKRLSLLTNWKPLGVFSIAGDDSPFLYFVRSVIVSFYEHIPQSSPFSLVRFREYEQRSSQWYVIRFLNHRILSFCRLMFDRSSGKGKTQIGMAKFHALKGFGEISTPQGVVFRRKNFANPILLPLREPQERTNGDRKTQKKNGGFKETELVH